MYDLAERAGWTPFDAGATDHSREAHWPVPRDMRADELVVFFEPRVRLSDGRLDGAETLVRWRHNGEIIEPGRFIEAVESSPVVRPFTAHVIDQGLREARQWPGEGIVSFNVPTAVLVDPAFQHWLVERVARSGLPPERIELELLERSPMPVHDHETAALGQLHEAGFRLALDDFGKGFHATTVPTVIPLDRVKLDRGLIDPVRPGNAAARALVRLLEPLRNRGVELVAEGVHSHTQLQALRHAGVDLYQGELPGLAMPADEFLARTAGNNGHSAFA